MFTKTTAPRYPTPARTEPQEPMLIVARTIIAAVPLHRRTASTFSSASSSSSTSATTSIFEGDEKAPLVRSSVKKASAAICNYGSMLKHSRTESRKAQLKQSISRPISQEPQWLDEDATEQEQEKQAEEMERSVGSVYSTRTWGGETERELSRIGGPFEYDDAETSRSSTQTFASSERSYTFF